jgi:peptidoglycan/xylan/chitin deacetylase (PgdA/CDA1 family)
MHMVCLTFDFDALSGWIARGMTSPTPISRGEFGAVASTRILALLKKYSLKTTWFVPGHTLETYPDECRAVHEAGHEIGHHGWTHRPPQTLSRADEARELERGNAAIRKLTGRNARGYRSPSWDLSPHSVDLLLEHGFAYESSMMANDYTPYRARRGDVIEMEKPAAFGAPTRLIEIPVSWSLDDYPHFEFVRTPNAVLPGLMSANGVLANWIDDFLYMKRETAWGVLTCTFHPFVIGRGHRMLMLERLVERLAAEGAEFVTMETVAARYDERAPFKG